LLTVRDVNKWKTMLHQVHAKRKEQQLGDGTELSLDAAEEYDIVNSYSSVAFSPLILLSDDEAASSAGTDTDTRNEEPEPLVSPERRVPVYNYAEPEVEVAEAGDELGSSEGKEQHTEFKMLEEPRLFDSCVASNPLILLSDDEAATSAGEDTESKEDEEVAETEARAKQPMYDLAEPEEEIAEAEVELGSSEGLELGASIEQSPELPFLTVPEVPRQAPEGMRLWQATANYVHLLRTADIGTEWAEVPACRRRKAKRATALVEILALGNAEQWSVVQELGIPVCPGCQRVLP
jgi:hypothetical protein